MILKDDISFYFIDSNNVPHYPGYVVGHEPPKLYFQSSANSQAELAFDKKFKDKQIMILIKFKPNPLHYQLQIVDDSAMSNNQINPPINSIVTKIRINPSNNIINKIGYSNRFLEDDNDYHNLLFEEKKMEHISANITK